MSEENKNNQEILDGGSGESETTRVKYPVKTANGVIPFVGKAYQKYGSSDVLSNEKIADANDLSVNSIKQILSTCQQYNFLKNIHGKGYKITTDFTKIFHPENDEEKIQTVISCLMQVPFYTQLFTSYNDSVVPHIDGLINKFMRDYGMRNNSASIAAEIFVQNLKDYGLLNNRNVLIVKRGIQPIPTAYTNPDTKDAVSSKPPAKPQEDDSDSGELLTYEFPLTENKKAILKYPKSNMVIEDFDIITMAIELLAKTKKFTLQIQLKKENEKGATAP